MDEYRERPSKSRRKREMRELQALAARIADCDAEARAELPLSETLRADLEEYDRIPSRDARKRHLRRLARLLDAGEDVDAIRAALERFEASSVAFARELHALEAWRDAMLATDAAIGAFIERFPQVDRPRLRRLVRDARAEQGGPDGARHEGRPASPDAASRARRGAQPRAYRELFRLLRETAREADALATLEPPDAELRADAP